MDAYLKLFPHSWVLIEAGSARVYIDPSYLSRYLGDHPSRIEFSSDDGLPEPLEKGDLILITHGDFDHLNPATVERLRADDTLVAGPPPCARALGSYARAVAEGDELSHHGLDVRVVPAHNTPEGRSTNKHHVPGESVGYVITIAGRRIYHAGDTDLIPEMSELKGVDVALLPIGGTYTMDIDEAVQAALLIEPALAIPMHTRQQADPREFVRKVESAGIRALAPGIGERIELPEKAPAAAQTS
jgi:L-ascorbate metabolism protein UlaG (beta-lactamase superfamily)